MPRNTRLTTFEKGQILVHHSNCISLSAIARELGRSRTVVTNFLRDQKRYNRKNAGGRPPKLTEADKRRILREGSKGDLGSAGIVKALQLSVKARRVRQVIAAAEHLRYKQIARTPAMRERHEKSRLKWAMTRMVWSNAKWSQIVWSDEKKFNLDRTGGLAYKWHDLRKEKEWFSKRQIGGSSVMVWACFAGSRISELVFWKESRMERST
ncbi:unnamed protein product [Chondrus crispus]|uniref:Tc3 transposase DNA binding domain-containing protein n=1 Tax=Chondrus crispus TaxID=2769 RepID=R7QB33_CHOCR|nr:unnamed protein product [Chondrus crispus]CDF34675.1 unnamed protein product [Chondrus crispus]|eukprot:XP_005714494.1 unnamed protein product [Chondrus crispus]